MCAGCDRLGNYSRVFGELLCTERHEWGDHGDHARLIQGVGFRVKFSSQIIREARFVKEFAPRRQIWRRGFHFPAFRSLRPGAPPRSAMNSTPESSNTARMRSRSRSTGHRSRDSKATMLALVAPT